MVDCTLPDLFIKVCPDGVTAELVRDFCIALEDGTHLCVPQGFVTDFVSVPRAFWRIIPPMGRYSKAAVVHDWLYYCGIFARSRADAIFSELMKRLDVPVWKRIIIYNAVRAGGWYQWNKHRAREKEKVNG